MKFKATAEFEWIGNILWLADRARIGYVGKIAGRKWYHSYAQFEYYTSEKRAMRA